MYRCIYTYMSTYIEICSGLCIGCSGWVTEGGGRASEFSTSSAADGAAARLAAGLRDRGAQAQRKFLPGLLVNNATITISLF